MNNKYNFLNSTLIFFLVVSLTSCIFLDKPDPSYVSTLILNYGEGSAKILSEHDDGNVPSGKRFTTDYNLGISLTSDTIKISKGVQFGVEYIIESPKTRLIEIKTVWNYPKKIINEFGKEFTKSEYYIDKLTNEYTYSSYEITDEFEMTEGDWVIELYYENKKILQKTFTLIGAMK